VIVAVSSDTVSDAAVQDLTVDANALSGINGVQLSTASRVTLSRVTVLNATIGIWLNGSADCKVLDCRVFELDARDRDVEHPYVDPGANIDTALDTGITITGATDCRVESTGSRPLGHRNEQARHQHCRRSDRAQVTGCPRIVPSGGHGCSRRREPGSVDSENLIDQCPRRSRGSGSRRPVRTPGSSGTVC
jgi:parallel beta-helix repeat protein